MPGIYTGTSVKLFRFSILIALLAATACAEASGNYFAPTAAVVCGSDIECTKIPEARIGDYLTGVVRNPATGVQFRGPQGPANLREAKRFVLNNLIRETVVRQHAAKIGITVTPREVTQRFNTIRSQFPNEEAFLSNLRRENLSPADLRIYLGNQLLFQQVADRLAQDQKPTEEELRSAYEQNKVGSFDKQVRVAHILICNTQDRSTGMCQTTENDRALATEIANKARSGEDFAALAKQSSKDPSNADKGGDLGYIVPGELVGEFESSAFALTEPGQISDPVVTPFGVHVIKLLSRGMSFEDARERIAQTMMEERKKAAYDEWMQSKVAEAKVKVNPKFGRYDPATRTVVPLKVQIPPSPNRGNAGASRAPQVPQDPQAPQDPQTPQDPGSGQNPQAPQAPPPPAAP